MCLRCKTPFRRHLIKDLSTGYIVCEDCGFAVEILTVIAYDHGKYIWELNPAWPVFSSFEDLMSKVLTATRCSLPPCTIIPGVPSLILTRAFDLLHSISIENKDLVH